MPETKYTNALISELQHYAEQPEWVGRKIQTVFFGGGTPSLFSAESIGSILRAADEAFGIDENAEITLEANPGTIQEQLGEDKLRWFRKVGVNRISMGVQSFSDEKLKKLGRWHSAADVPSAVANIKAAGFDNFNLDLIFGVTGESLGNWARDLEMTLSLQPTHLSCYGLTIEPGTEFGRQAKRGYMPAADDDMQAEMFRLTQQVLGDSGYEQYEISNYSKPELRCRHNMAYWSGDDYLGLGAGAHSFSSKSKQRWSNIPGPELFTERAFSKGEAAQRKDLLNKEKEVIEFFFLGLRTTDGISASDFEAKFGSPFTAEIEKSIVELKNDGLLQQEDETITLTSKGFRFADSVLSELIAE